MMPTRIYDVRLCNNLCDKPQEVRGVVPYYQIESRCQPEASTQLVKLEGTMNDE